MMCSTTFTEREGTQQTNLILCSNGKEGGRVGEYVSLIVYIYL